jgi:hypothetical protein
MASALTSRAPNTADLKLSLPMVEQIIAYFNDIQRIPDDDVEQMTGLVREFARFEKVVQRGATQPGEATELAKQFVLFGRNWLKDNPSFRGIYHEAISQR